MFFLISKSQNTLVPKIVIDEFCLKIYILFILLMYLHGTKMPFCQKLSKFENLIEFCVPLNYIQSTKMHLCQKLPKLVNFI